MEDIDKDVKKILDSLNEKEKNLLPAFHNPKFPYALSILLRMKGYKTEDIVKISTKICEYNFKNVLS